MGQILQAQSLQRLWIERVIRPDPPTADELQDFVLVVLQVQNQRMADQAVKTPDEIPDCAPGRPDMDNVERCPFGARINRRQASILRAGVEGEIGGARPQDCLLYTSRCV